MKKNHSEISLAKGFLLSADQISERFFLTVVSAKFTFILGDQRVRWVVSHITPKTEWFYLYNSKEHHEHIYMYFNFDFLKVKALKYITLTFPTKSKESP
jgi:hypothetical protein